MEGSSWELPVSLACQFPGHRTQSAGTLVPLPSPTRAVFCPAGAAAHLFPGGPGRSRLTKESQSRSTYKS